MSGPLVTDQPEHVGERPLHLEASFDERGRDVRRLQRRAGVNQHVRLAEITAFTSIAGAPDMVFAPNLNVAPPSRTTFSNRRSHPSSASILNRFAVTSGAVERTGKIWPHPGVCFHQTTGSPGMKLSLGTAVLRSRVGDDVSRVSAPHATGRRKAPTPLAPSFLNLPQSTITVKPLSGLTPFLSWGVSGVTKKEIVKQISRDLRLSQLQTKDIVQRTFDAITRRLVIEGRIELRNFGVFEVKRRAARKARNPRTGEKLITPPRNVVTFKPGKEMEELVGNAAREKPEAAREPEIDQAPVPKPASPSRRKKRVSIIPAK